MKKIILMMMLAVAAASQADLIVNLAQGTDLVTANPSNAGLVDGQVAFTTSTLSPSPASYTGPAFFGGAGHTATLASWRVANHATADYLDASGVTAPGQQVWALYMFAHQSSTITQATVDVRTTGTGANQSLQLRLVVRKDNGSYYISQSRTNPQNYTYVQSALAGLEWYEYAPASSLTGIGSLVENFQLDEVNAIGQLIVGLNTSASTFTMGASTRKFQAWGVIPEPATVGMLGLGALVTLLIRRLRV
jgi:hypothetical protein